MANALTELDSLSGLFPGAHAIAAGASTPAAGAGVDGERNDDGYVCIPVNSIYYTGGLPNRLNTTDDGAISALTAGDGDIAGTSTGSFRQFARGMHVSLSRYTAECLTGNNAFTYWGESSGNYSVYNATTLSKRYTTNLYYEAGDGLGLKGSAT